MNGVELKRTLDELAEGAVPAGVNLWPGVEARAAQELKGRKQHGARLGRVLPRSRVGWAVAALAALLVVGATAYAASPVLGRLLTMDAQFRNEDAQKLGQTLNLSQTLGDVTVTVQWAYADPRRVLVGYAIKTTDGRRFDPGEALLTDANGTALHSNGGYGVTGHSDILGVSLLPGESSNVIIFDSPAGAGAQTPSLKLHFHLTTAEYAYPIEAATPVTVGNTAQAQPAKLLATTGPFEFDFEVPVRPAP